MINVAGTIAKLDDPNLETRTSAYDALVFDTPELHPEWYIYFAGALKDESPAVRLYGVFGITYLRLRFNQQYVIAALLDHPPDEYPGLRMLIENLLRFFLFNNPDLLRDRIELNVGVRQWQYELWENLEPRPWELISDQMDDLILRLMDRHRTNQAPRAARMKSLREILAQIKFTN